MIVLVSGSSKAIGAETARQFALCGARVVVHGRDEQAIGRVVSSVQAEGGDCFGAAADATSAGDLLMLQTRIREKVR